MIKEALFHEANSVWSFIEEESYITLIFRTSNQDQITVETIEYNRFYDYNERITHPMSIYLEDELFRYHITSFIPNHYGCVYYFKITDGNQIDFYTEYGLTKKEPFRLGAFEIPRIQKADVYIAPKFVKDTVFYQIYPDRFRREGKKEEKFEMWGGKPTFYNLFGGNFKGITLKLEYLKARGINAIYFTPINLSPSSHRYDTIDYMKIDPILGTDAEFKELVERCHDFGIKVVIDAVFNHCSHHFFAFQDVLEHQSNSKYVDWFLIERYPISFGRNGGYQTYGQEPQMPKLNSQNPEVRAYLLQVVRHYMLSFQIDGWRLDVADEVDSEFWRMFRTEVKAMNPEAIIIGEVFHNPSYYLRGDQFDSVQNYQFYDIVHNYFVRRDTNLHQFKNQIVRLLTMVPRNVLFSLLNQVDSHDTPRLLTSLEGNLNNFKLAVLFQFTYIGMPCVYYGDEIGMVGGADPDNRRCFNWDESTWNKDVLGMYDELIKLRKHEVILQNGYFRFIDNNDRLLTYERYIGSKKVRITINPNSTITEGIKPYGAKVSKMVGDKEEILLDWR